MSQARLAIIRPEPMPGSATPADRLGGADDPARGFANAIVLSVPLWGMIGLALWLVL